ncbi:MAG: YihY/virulence factor BrkB family protein [Ruminococcaceae bacterium]|nr:YihY/virulence factor BrkB family protein [Oscillospiraceae bacterium]
MKLYKKILNIINIINKDNVFLFAAQAAFYIIIASIPSIMMLMSLAKFILPVSQEYLLSATSPLIPEIIKSPVTGIISELYNNSTFSIASITAFSALWSASRGVAAVERGIRNVYHTPPRKSFIKAVIASFFYTIIFTLLIIVFLVVVVFGTHIIDLLQVKSNVIQLIFGRSYIPKWIFTYVMMTFVFAFLFSAFSGKKLRFRYHFPGAIFTAGGWMIFSVLYSFYIENFANYSYIYGSLTAIVLLMLWVYFCMVIFLLGGEVNKLVLVSNVNRRKHQKNVRESLKTTLDEIINDNKRSNY